jgi:hypothetical protein
MQVLDARADISAICTYGVDIGLGVAIVVSSFYQPVLLQHFEMDIIDTLHENMEE